jgi:hypothetical protein
MCCAVLCCCLVLQFFDSATKQYTIQMLADRQVIRHTLDHTLWRMARKSDAGGAAGPAAAAAGQGPDREGLVGQRIEVWWPAEKTFFAGRVAVSAGTLLAAVAEAVAFLYIGCPACLCSLFCWQYLTNKGPHTQVGLSNLYCSDADTC